MSRCHLVRGLTPTPLGLFSWRAEESQWEIEIGQARRKKREYVGCICVVHPAPHLEQNYCTGQPLFSLALWDLDFLINVRLDRLPSETTRVSFSCLFLFWLSTAMPLITSSLLVPNIPRCCSPLQATFPSP